MTAPPLPRDAARDWIRRALLGVFPQHDPRTLEEAGDEILALAEKLGIPDEATVWWIHCLPPYLPPRARETR